jgi:K(+)-stimulated pyrophosphate-energized sodium pump
MIPVVFFCISDEPVGKAMDMVYEVRPVQEIPGIMEGTGKPEYAKCVDISTKPHKRNDVAWNFDHWISIVVVLLGKLVYGDNNQLVRNAWRIYGWCYCLGSTLGSFSKQRRCLG